MTDKLPRATRPYRLTLVAVAALLADDAYLGLTVREMVARVMKESHGAANPVEVDAICQRLKDEAGV